MKLSVIISNRNDIAMLVVTVRSCIEELRPLGHENCEIIICDNSDQEHYETLKGCIPVGYIKSGLIKIIRQDYPCLFTAREAAIAASSGQYFACVDSHMLIGRDMFVDLVNFMDVNTFDKTIAFAHAPINWAHQHESSSRHDRDVSSCELGDWGMAYNTPRPITWKGMPWICTLETWSKIGGYGALAEHKLSWGGGDMHIGIKPWLLGMKNVAVPTSPGIHIGPFPKIDIGDNPHSVKVSTQSTNQYRLWSKSGNGPHALGFLVSCYVLGGEAMMERNKEAIGKRFGKFINLSEWWDKAKELGQGEKDWLDKQAVYTFEGLLEATPWNER